MSSYEPLVTKQIQELIESKSAEQRDNRRLSKDVVDAERSVFHHVVEEWGLERAQDFFRSI